MMHLRDLQKLEGVLSPSHLEVNYYPRLSFHILLLKSNLSLINSVYYLQEMEFAHSLRQSKVNIKICQVIPIPIQLVNHGLYLYM